MSQAYEDALVIKVRMGRSVPSTYFLADFSRMFLSPSSRNLSNKASLLPKKRNTLTLARSPNLILCPKRMTRKRRTMMKTTKTIPMMMVVARRNVARVLDLSATLPRMMDASLTTPT